MFNLRIIASAVFALLVTVGTLRAQNSSADSSISGLYLLLGAVSTHPMVAASEANVEAARHRIAQRSALPNPMLMLGAENLPTNSLRFSEDPMTAKMIGVSQELPFPGKLRAEAEIAAQDTITTQTQVSEQANMLARDIKIAYFELYHLEREIATYQFHVDALNQLIRLTESKMSTGKATQNDVLNLELERVDNENQVIEDRTMIAMQQADLERATGGMADNAAITSSLGFPTLPFTIVQLDSIAKRNRPQFISLRAQAEQQSLLYQRSELDRYPNFQVGLQYMQRDALSPTSPMNPMREPMTQSDMISATVSIELPFNFNAKRSEAQEEAEAMRTMKQSEESAAELDVHAQLESNLAKLRGTWEEYRLLRDEVYPAAKASLETSNANYTYDKTAIDQVVRNELNLLHREHDKYRLEAEYNKTLATIEYLTGTTLVTYTSRTNWRE